MSRTLFALKYCRRFAVRPVVSRLVSTSHMAPCSQPPGLAEENPVHHAQSSYSDEHAVTGDLAGTKECGVVGEFPAVSARTLRAHISDASTHCITPIACQHPFAIPRVPCLEIEYMLPRARPLLQLLTTSTNHLTTFHRARAWLALPQS